MGWFGKKDTDWQYTDGDGIKYRLNYTTMRLVVAKLPEMALYQVRRTNDGTWQIRPHIEALQSQAEQEVQEYLQKDQRDLAGTVAAMWEVRLQRYDVDEPWTDLSGQLSPPVETGYQKHIRS
jgi:hypothetical protein